MFCSAGIKYYYFQKPDYIDGQGWSIWCFRAVLEEFGSTLDVTNFLQLHQKPTDDLHLCCRSITHVCYYICLLLYIHHTIMHTNMVHTLFCLRLALLVGILLEEKQYNTDKIILRVMYRFKIKNIFNWTNNISVEVSPLLLWGGLLLWKCILLFLLLLLLLLQIIAFLKLIPHFL